MKLANPATTFLCSTLLAVMPAVASAGGLLDAGCGCATQKGGSVIQKSSLLGPIVQKGGVHQKGGACQTCGVTQKGGIVQKGAVQKAPAPKGVIQKGVAQKGIVQKGVAQKGMVHQKGGIVQKGACGDCGTCDICIPNPVPLLLAGIDKVLNTVFACNACGAVCSTGCSSYGSSCGCGGAVDYMPGAPLPDAVPGNPFIDDLQAPPVPQPNSAARSRQARTIHSASNRPAETIGSGVRVAVTSRPQPRPAEVVAAKPRLAPVVNVSAETESGLLIPRNPLRGE